ncbi:GLPGLI family protein [Flavobacterium fryxellicola]|nr:GLPGLI family protein [Flavobacterium fryxellicola]SHN78034.1 GLPGLI family protein [Flavobacterium fryxellicola]
MKFLCLCLMLVTTAYTQSSGKVKYKFYVPLKLEGNPSENTKQFVIKMVDYANKQEFELIFNKLQSKFLLIETMNYSSDYERKINNIARTAFTSPDTYTNLTQKSQVSLLSDGTLIEGKMEKNNWEITGESKYIGNYLCYKAILKIPYISRKGDPKVREVISWFAPSLPYSYGPKSAFGLPGLVLEFTEDEKTFIASKIELFEKEIQIDFPKGKTVTKEEYDKKLESSMGCVLIGKKREMEKDKQ